MIEYLDLQLFGEGEKTEKPTSKKRSDARKEGQILQSKELSTVAILFSCFLGLRFFGNFMKIQVTNFVLDIFKEIINADYFFKDNNGMINFFKIITVYFITIAPIALIAFFSALIISYAQVGFLFTTNTLKLKLNRLNPLEGFKRMFSKRAITDLIKSVLKIVLVGYVALNYVESRIDEIVQFSRFEILESLSDFSSIFYGAINRILLILLAISFLDYFFQWREHEKNLMMSKQEIKEEYKQTEGDPQIKGKIKERQRKLAMSRMMQSIPKADVIITNPTHFAVAIKYEKDLYDAPYVLGKGQDIVAENIKKVGAENEIPIVENKPLARALYDTVEINQIIPEDLYEAVAEVLAYVYSLKEEF